MKTFKMVSISISLFLLAWGGHALNTQLPVVAPYNPPAENTLEVSCSAMVDLFHRYQSSTVENNHVVTTYLGQLALATSRYQEHLTQFEGQKIDFSKGQFSNVETTANNMVASVENLYIGDEVLSNFFYEILEVLPECLTIVGAENLKPEDQDLLNDLEDYRSDATEIESTAAMFVEQKTMVMEALATQLSAVEGTEYEFSKGSFQGLGRLASEFLEASQLIQSSTSNVEKRLSNLIERIKKRLEGMGSLAQAS